MSYLKNLFIAVDNAMNAVRGGYHDTSISACVSYFAATTKQKRWQYLERVINWVMCDENHCFAAYLSDKDEKFIEGNTLSIIFLWAVVILTAPALALIIRVQRWT